ncbi:MAG: pyridoxal phosphate-dependent aminotransferase [Chrysiogenetes bacterium]|nr:pyridoxal phosphate-dependent aminotransferase [Chrysiogenetes bacterium]
MHYEPAPRGLLSAREALALHLSAKGIDADPSRMLLTASTSEAYSFLFKLFCDPEDEILVPAPSYPLLEHLLTLESARPAPYHLCLTEGGWRIDFDSLENALTVRTKALVVINPNNPTGNCLDPEDRALLVEIARRERLALISDEVFLDYGFDGADLSSHSLAGQSEVLCFVLGGLSKSLALPQLKLGWMLVSGPEAELSECLDRLEFIADSYLSLAAPVQVALPGLLALEAAQQAPIKKRLAENRAALAELLSGGVLGVLPAQGGWYAVITLPDGLDDEALAIELVCEDGVIVQPGYFFDLESPASVVVSLLTPPEDFRAGIAALLKRARG